MTCDCATRFDVRLARNSDYAAFKRLLDVGRHPAFIGRQCFATNADNGGALLYEFDGRVVAASLINPHYGILLALHVHPEHRGHGLGKSIMRFLMPNFARVVEDKVPWFESIGYVAVGKMKQGIRLRTQVMARAALFELAGRLQGRLRKTQVGHSAESVGMAEGCEGRIQRGRKTKETRNA